jgi:hypothetical protein
MHKVSSMQAIALIISCVDGLGCILRCEEWIFFNFFFSILWFSWSIKFFIALTARPLKRYLSIG